MRNNFNNRVSFLGILFSLFTIGIGVFALNEFKSQHTNFSGNIGSRITVKFQKDSIYKKFFKDKKKNPLTNVFVSSSSSTKDINIVDSISCQCLEIE